MAVSVTDTRSGPAVLPGVTFVWLAFATPIASSTLSPLVVFVTALASTDAPTAPDRLPLAKNAATWFGLDVDAAVGAAPASIWPAEEVYTWKLASVKPPPGAVTG